MCIRDRLHIVSRVDKPFAGDVNKVVHTNLSSASNTQSATRDVLAQLATTAADNSKQQVGHLTSKPSWRQGVFSLELKYFFFPFPVVMQIRYHDQ